MNQPVVLTVAGFDPSGGAGVLADIKTISAFGCYGVAAVTSLTFQNTQRVFGKHNQSVESLRRQIEPLFADFEIAAIKTGMLPTAEIIREIAAIIEKNRVPVIVVDPVIKSTSGFDLVDDSAVSAMNEALIPLASVVTPNVTEARRLASSDADPPIEVRRAAEILLDRGARAVLVTGGDVTVSDGLSTDLLLDALGSITYSSERIESSSTHGTGCTLASAIACLLTRGHSLRAAVPLAKQYINQAILSAPRLGLGQGPLNHFPSGFEINNE